MEGETPPTTYKCKKCERIFLEHIHYLKHQKKKCQEPIKCSGCNLTFDRRTRLMKHQAKGKKIKCECHDQTFCNVSIYEQHMRSNTKPVTRIVDINQKIQPATGYEDEDGYEELLTSKNNEIHDHVLAGITNIQAKITNIKKVLLGSPPDLPAYIKNSKSIHTLTHCHGKKYVDSLCFFRCLALHQGYPIHGLEKGTQRLKAEFEVYRDQKFDDGISIYDIPQIEVKYKLSVNIYSLMEDGTAETIYASLRAYTGYIFRLQ